MIKHHRLYKGSLLRDYYEYIRDQLTDMISSRHDEEGYHLKNKLFELRSKYPTTMTAMGELENDVERYTLELILSLSPDALGGINIEEFISYPTEEKIEFIQTIVDPEMFSEYMKKVRELDKEAFSQKTPAQYSPAQNINPESLDSLFAFGSPQFKWPKFSWNKKSVTSVPSGIKSFVTEQTWAKVPCTSEDTFDPNFDYYDYQKVADLENNCYRKVNKLKKESTSGDRWAKVPCTPEDTFDPNFDNEYYKKVADLENNCYRKVNKFKKESSSGDRWAKVPCTPEDTFDPNFDSEDYKKVADLENNCYKKVIDRDKLYKFFLGLVVDNLSTLEGFDLKNEAHWRKLDKIFIEYEDSISVPGTFHRANAEKWFKDRFTNLYFGYNYGKRSVKRSVKRRFSTKKAKKVKSVKRVKRKSQKKKQNKVLIK